MTSWADTFVGRTVGTGGWGTASDGEAWNILNNGGLTLQVSGGNGMFTEASTSQVAYLQLGSNTGVDEESLFTGALSVYSSTSDEIGNILRITGTGGTMNCYLFLIGANIGTQWRIVKVTNNVGVTLTSGTFNSSGATNYRLRFRAQGALLYGKAWLSSGAEPDAWTGTAIDTGFSQGGVGLYVRAGSGVTGTVNNFSAKTLLSNALLTNRRVIGRIQ